jgi:hypothetical protein
MNNTLISRYQRGGDIYQTLLTQYGQANADAIANAALSGDETQVNAAIVQAQYGQPLNTSTGSILYQQLTTDPLGAPLQSLNTGLTNTMISLLKSPAVLVTLGVAAFLFLGGADWIRRNLASK